MTAAAFADLVQARSLGRGRWQARCPAHPDRSPSLAIKDGREGRVLVRCWAGCELRDVLAALKLTTRDLFPGKALSPQAARRARSKQEARDMQVRERVHVERRLADVHRRLSYAVDSLGSRLARTPEGDESLTALFHTALLWQCTAAAGFADA